MGMTRAAYWDGEAASYDRTTAFFEKRLFAEARAWIADRVEGSTLEVGSGTGANLPYYATRATDVTLADVSGAMLAAASTRARDLGVSPRTLHGDGAHLDLPDDAFDTVICTFIMCCVEDERAVLRELARVLKPGGRLLMADHVDPPRPGRAARARRVHAEEGGRAPPPPADPAAARGRPAGHGDDGVPLASRRTRGSDEAHDHLARSPSHREHPRELQHHAPRLPRVGPVELGGVVGQERRPLGVVGQHVEHGPQPGPGDPLQDG